ncbi:MAG: malectin domain-containing carbohydrate-binding protein, partial [Terriglobia bacterium]
MPVFCLWSTDMAMLAHNHDERGELENVLSSGIFAKAPGQAKLLKYICDEYFLGRADRIKEYNLATEALGRAADFDQNRDAIVRVEVHRLRRKLKEYYEGEGAGHALRIVIDPGHYAPRFVPRDELPSTELEADSGPSEVRENQNFELPQRMGRGVTADTKPSGLHALPIAVGALVLAVVMAGVLLEWRKHLGAWVKASPAASPSSLAGSPVLAGALDSVRILCGYPKDKYIDRAGNFWLGDRYYSGGVASSQPPQFLARAPEMTLYQTFRSGNFSYHIPLKPGNYELHLYFVETHYGPGSLSGGGEASRLFDV